MDLKLEEKQVAEEAMSFKDLSSSQIKLEIRQEQINIPKQEILPKLKVSLGKPITTTIKSNLRNTIQKRPKPIGVPKPKEPLLSRLVTKIQKQPEIFEAFTTKEGKDISLGKARTQKEAEKKLKKSLLGTLRASGYLTAGGKKIEAKKLGLLKFQQFRTSKVSKSRIVQRKEKRLGAKSETKEIQYFKSKAKNKKSKKNSFGL